MSVLLDLKHLLVEARQEVPVFLQTLDGADANLASNKPEDKGCAYCSGLGHRISNCPKLENVQSKVSKGQAHECGSWGLLQLAQNVQRPDFLSSGGDW